MTASRPGRLTVTFAGDPAAGCATSGLCDYSGTETLAPGAENLGDLSLTTTERGSRRSTSVTLFLGPPGSPVHSSVQRTTSTAAGTETASCSDSAGSALSPGGSFFTLPVSGGRVTVGLIHTAAPVLGSRCAGPLGPDVASALPQRTVALRALERGGTTIDLTGGGRFAAHGFSGTVTSTLVFRTGRPQHIRRSRSVPPRAGSVHITHFASVQYGVARLTGTAIATVRSAAAAAACGPFDACGLGGAITISPGPSVHGAAFLAAESSRVGARVLRAQLRGAGPAATFLQGAGSVNVHGSVRARLAQGSGSCTDSVALAQFTLRLTRRGHWLEVSLAPSRSAAADPLRTRCPGPDLGPFTNLAGARLPASVLGRPSFTAKLHGHAFSDGPYRVSTQSTLTLTLRRGRTRSHVVRIVSISTHGSASGR